MLYDYIYMKVQRYSKFWSVRKVVIWGQWLEKGCCENECWGGDVLLPDLGTAYMDLLNYKTSKLGFRQLYFCLDIILQYKVLKMQKVYWPQAVIAWYNPSPLQGTSVSVDRVSPGNPFLREDVIGMANSWVLRFSFPNLYATLPFHLHSLSPDRD